MNFSSLKKISKSDLMMIADMRGVKVRKASKQDELFRILKKNVKKAYNESPFKSIIFNIRSILPKTGCKKIEKGLEYVEEMKELTSLQIKNGKNNLIKLQKDLIERFKTNDRRKKADKEYHEYEKNKFHGLKDVRNLFNQNDDDDNYEEIECLFYESDVNQSIEEIIESCELIEDEDEINDLIDCLETIFNKAVEITFNYSPFKSLISDIRTILPKDGCKKLKKRLKCIRELRKSTTLEIDRKY